MKRGFCKICRFLERNQWDRKHFEEQIAKGLSLEKLKVYLSAKGLECDTKTISSHLKHVDSSIIEQRREERSIKKKIAKPFQKLRDKFFINPELAVPKECEHPRDKQIHHFNMSKEVVQVYCGLCRKLLLEYDPEKERKNSQRDLMIYASLTRRRKR